MNDNSTHQTGTHGRMTPGQITAHRVATACLQDAIIHLSEADAFRIFGQREVEIAHMAMPPISTPEQLEALRAHFAKDRNVMRALRILTGETE